jgi:hypothetical protein
VKFLALGTPLLVLGAIFVLQRLESWAIPSPRSRRKALRAAPAAPSAGKSPADPAPPRRRKMMNHPTSPTPDERDGPLLRDPPPPPGYVDPLDESQVLKDLSRLPGPSLFRRAPPARRSRRRER